jgi:hypothetical protein
MAFLGTVSISSDSSCGNIVYKIKSAPSIIVVVRTCLSNNGRINLSKNFEIPVVRKFIEETIGLNGVPG